MFPAFIKLFVFLAAKALLHKNPHPTTDEIRRAQSGNLCRCMGYTKIIEVIEVVSEERERRMNRGASTSPYSPPR
jgi:aerobic-type carbon monoxide dehydrogenase small subunit (CoxS/CutS family)